ncbi:MAG: sulfatase-like hydrolase/transferase [Rikenellaceae bacterium]
MTQKITLSTCCVLTIALSAKGESIKKDIKPNILIILIDDAGYNDFGFMGSKDLQTPNIDALSKHGTIFTDAHVSATVSGPSRAGILTGRYQQRFGYECNPTDTLWLSQNEKTIGDIFSENGYRTSAIGKWHQGKADVCHPNNRGFDHFFGFISGSRSYFYRPDRDDKPGRETNLQLNGTIKRFNGYLTDVLADEAANFINNTNDPFMMYLAFNAVHTPMEATESDLAIFKDHPRKKLAAMTFALDRAVGKVVDELKKSGKYNNTLIFFLSDNGGATTNQSNNYPLKGFKGNKFEGGHRVPMLMVWGDKLSSIKRYDGLSSSLDILATAMEAAGIKKSSLSNKIDGTDLIAHLNGKIKSAPHDELFWRKDKMAAARVGAMKMIRVEGLGYKLYNLKDDLREDNNIESQEQLNAIKKRMAKWESGLIAPLWTEGFEWDTTTMEIHRDLMLNRPVRYYSPSKELLKGKKNR